jgi:hypothetical protein
MTPQDDARRLDEIERQQSAEYDRQFGLDYFLSLQRDEAEREVRMAGVDLAAQIAAGLQAIARWKGVLPELSPRLGPPTLIHRARRSHA